jgi:hypothetical protein
MPKNQYAEASELGLPPGSFPATLGDGYWTRCRPITRNGELQSWIYTHGLLTLEVFND